MPRHPAMSAAETQPGPPRGAHVLARHRGMSARTLLIAALTLVSRILGFVREYLSARLFGDASGIYDAFITAWRVPNLFRRFLGEGALSTSLQTSMTEADSEHGDEAGRRLFWSTMRAATWILVAATALLMLGAALVPDAMPGTGWAWLGADPGAVREMVVRLAPFLPLVCISALVGGALMVRGRFGPPHWAPAAMNVVWIGALVALALGYGWEGETDEARHLEMARWLCWGVLLAGVAQLVVQLPGLARAGLMGGSGGAGETAVGGAARVLRTSAPLALGAAAYQINVMIDGFMAEGLLPDGGPTTLYYANRVQQFPMALVAVAATTAVFPRLKLLGHGGERGELRRLHDRTHFAILFWALPAACGLFALSRPVVEVLFHHGAFGERGVERTTAALRMLCLALPAAGATGLVARTFYALGDFATPVRVSTGLLAVNALLNALFVLGFGMDVEGLALATAITGWVGLGLLLRLLLPRLPATTSLGGAGRLARTSAAALACGGAAWGGWVGARAVLAEGPALLAAIGLGALAYGVAARGLGLPEASDLRRLGERLRGGKAPPP